MTNKKSLRIVVTGLRGVPDIQGGIETHAQNLYPFVADAGHDVTVFARRTFVDHQAPYQWAGLKVIPTWSPKAASLEAIGHTAGSLLRAARERPDVLHIHGVGPALVAPLARLLGMRVLVTHHGRTYESAKWGAFAKMMLRLGETMAMQYADAIICVAKFDADRINKQSAGNKACAIPNGLPQMPAPGDTTLLKQLGLQPGRYVLHVGRIVPEKRHLDLIEAFRKAAMPDWKLVLVGSAMHQSDYAMRVTRACESCPAVVSAGHRQGKELSTLYGGAGFFVLPSALEGFSISILEALGFGLPCLLSDIPGNLEFGLPESTYFPMGNIDAMAAGMIALAQTIDKRNTINALEPDLLPDRFHWHSIAQSTIAVMQSITSS